VVMAHLNFCLSICLNNPRNNLVRVCLCIHLRVCVCVCVCGWVVQHLSYQTVFSCLRNVHCTGKSFDLTIWCPVSFLPWGPICSSFVPSVCYYVFILELWISLVLTFRVFVRFRCSQQWRCWCCCSGLWHCVHSYVDTNILEKHTLSFFRV
jgi:hypothetical protein